jgi:hypothetical protein
MLGQRGCRRERLGAAAEVLVQDVERRVVAAGEVAEQCRIGATEPVDALVVVADGHDLAVVADQLLDERDLGAVDVLELVDEQPAPALPSPVAQPRIAGQDGPGGDDQVVVVEPAARSTLDLDGLGKWSVQRRSRVLGRWPHHSACLARQRPGIHVGEAQLREAAAAVREERIFVEVRGVLGQGVPLRLPSAQHVFDEARHDGLGGRCARSGVTGRALRRAASDTIACASP